MYDGRPPHDVAGVFAVAELRSSLTQQLLVFVAAMQVGAPCVCVCVCVCVTGIVTVWERNLKIMRYRGVSIEYRYRYPYVCDNVVRLL